MLAEVSQFLQKIAEPFHAEVSTFTVPQRTTKTNIIFSLTFLYKPKDTGIVLNYQLQNWQNEEVGGWVSEICEILLVQM